MKKFLVSIITGLALAFPWAVSAETITVAPCTVGPGNCATGITGLVSVNSTPYDVAFINTGSYDTVYAGGPAPTLGSSTDAFNVATAILASLIAWSTPTLDGIVADAGVEDYFLVPYKLHGPLDSNPGYVDFWYGVMVGGIWQTSVGDCNVGSGCVESTYYDAENILFGYSDSWVVFTSTASNNEVPEPASLALLGLGLAGLGFARRKKAQ